MQNCTYNDSGAHMANICSEAKRIDDIIEVKDWDQRIHFHEHEKGLFDALRGSEDGHFESRGPADLRSMR